MVSNPVAHFASRGRNVWRAAAELESEPGAQPYVAWRGIMANHRADGAGSNHRSLRCRHCGNSDKFLEVMLRESHVVNGDLVYIHLAEAVVDEYRCLDCGELVKPAAA